MRLKNWDCLISNLNFELESLLNWVIYSLKLSMNFFVASSQFSLKSLLEIRLENRSYNVAKISPGESKFFHIFRQFEAVWKKKEKKLQFPYLFTEG